jgi:hypothetical protein
VPLYVPLIFDRICSVNNVFVTQIKITNNPIIALIFNALITLLGL